MVDNRSQSLGSPSTNELSAVNLRNFNTARHDSKTKETLLEDVSSQKKDLK